MRCLGRVAKRAFQFQGTRFLVCEDKNDQSTKTSISDPSALSPALVARFTVGDEASQKNPALPLQSAQTVTFLKAFWEFTRPHTIIGTVLSVISVSLLSIGSAQHGWSLFAANFKTLVPRLLSTLVAALSCNVFITGLNQISDVDIDKINKPYLPLAAGTLTMSEAVGIVTVMAVIFMSIVVGPLSTVPLAVTVLLSAVLGFCYSIPPFRWKRSPQVAAISIFAVRGLVAQLGFFAHTRALLSLPPWQLSPPLVYACAMFLLFGLVIALAKDLPDVKGDQTYKINTFSVTYGPKIIFHVCVGLLLGIYACGALWFGLRATSGWLRWPGMLGNVALGLVVLSKSKSVELSTRESIVDFYMFIW
eukprot:CAMPEP_0184666110 /NCGR_PEP_ID=MMETSP0308-20130426/60099_1 /TAXON_ID=38269 /ORGANISM="Gloeochaete witrockiana, Strain SAG 46.84" /LENGTH=361 /DNA_ID=CAMNT_0027110537 /DNA_START=132 /DNA_END=1214 /DNA_ORIENTATION=-